MTANLVEALAESNGIQGALTSKNAAQAEAFTEAAQRFPCAKLEGLWVGYGHGILLERAD